VLNHLDNPAITSVSSPAAVSAPHIERAAPFPDLALLTIYSNSKKVEAVRLLGIRIENTADIKSG